MKKIMFSDQYGLTQAVLEGRKTMTRRAMKPVSENIDKMKHFSPCRDGVNVRKDGSIFYRFDQRIYVPSYKVGEVVAIAQRYSDMNRSTFPVFVGEKGVFRKTENSSGWNNKMYVQADLMPHRIRITDIRVERLQDITEEDCLREGVRKLESEGNPTMFTFDGWKFKNKVNRCADSPKEAFAVLIKKMYGKKTWDDNPWVFVYKFELVK